MRSENNGQVIGIPVASVGYVAQEMPGKPAHRGLSKYRHPALYDCSLYRQDKKDTVIDWMSKFSKKADSYARGIREHVNLSPKISETVKGKLSLGARIIQAGGIERVFRRYFPISKREKLLKVCQCYLSTTSGPIAGLLFISTEKIAFRSDRSLTFTSPASDLVRIPYKVSIPLKKIESQPQ